MNEEMTDQELKAMGIPRVMFNQWQAIMNVLWKVLRKRYPRQTSNDNDNGISVSMPSGKHRIVCHVVNSTYCEVKVSRSDIDILTLRYEDNLSKVALIVLNVLDNGIYALIQQ